VENPAKPRANDAYGQLTELASTFHHVDGLFYFTYVVCIVFFVLITGVLAYSVVAYRRKTFDQPAVSNVTHNTPLEVVWTVIPLIIVMVMFAWGYIGAQDMMIAPANARVYTATAKQWNWTFKYPNDPIASYGELWLEVDKPALFQLESTDVLHAFCMPATRRTVAGQMLQALGEVVRREGGIHFAPVATTACAPCRPRGWRSALARPAPPAARACRTGVRGPSKCGD
jgi:hypothetical protein